MKKKAQLEALAVSAPVLAVGTTAEAQLPKSGTRRRKFSTVLAVLVAVLLCSAMNSEAQMAKSGDFSGVFRWTFPLTQAVQIEKDRWIWGGLANGSFRNDAGEGFLHATATVCTALGEMNKTTVVHNNGDCAFTDKDGDKAFLMWQCVICPTDDFRGELKWTGGTGKYSGLIGKGTYQQATAAPGNGWWMIKGNYQLP